MHSALPLPVLLRSSATKGIVILLILKFHFPFLAIKMLIANSLHLHWTDPQLHLPVLVKSEAHGEDAADEDPSMKEEPKAVT